MSTGSVSSAAATDSALGFAWTSGSVVGRAHRLAGRNNQDAVRVRSGSNAIAAVVCDGCGSGPHSEVGAHLQAEFLAAACHASAPAVAALPAAPGETDLERPDLERLAAELARVVATGLAPLGSLAAALAIDAPADPRAVRDHLLATAVAALLTPTWTIVWAIGDGVWGVNGDCRVRTVAANAPAYPAYALVPHAVDAAVLAAARSPSILWAGRSDQVTSLVLGSDGAAELLARAHDSVPGTTEPVGPLAAWAADAALYAHPQALPRRLARVARDEQHVDWDAGRLVRAAGLLADDATLWLLRRTAPADGLETTA